MVSVKSFVAVAAIAVAIACVRDPDPAGAATPKNRGGSVDAKSVLVLLVDAREEAPIGYGAVWKAQVRKVVDGRLPDREIHLRLEPNADGKLYGGRFRYGEALEEKSVTLRFRRAVADQAALIGFTAASGTSWELVDVNGK